MYKVVRRLSDWVRVSAVINHELMVKYDRHKFARAQVGQLFVFEYVRDAINFIKTALAEDVTGHFEIWRVDTDGELRPLRHVPYAHGPTQLREFWSASPGLVQMLYSTPGGTYVTDGVKLDTLIYTVNIRFGQPAEFIDYREPTAWLSENDAPTPMG